MTDDFYKDIADDTDARFDTSGYNTNHLLPIGVNKKVIDVMKDELGGRIMTEFVALRLKLYAYRTLSGSGDKKCIVKKTLNFEDHKQCLFVEERMHLGNSCCSRTSSYS